MCSLPTAVVRLECSLHCFYPCFWSTARALPGGCWQSPKFQGRNTLLKTGVWVKVVPKITTAPPTDGVASLPTPNIWCRQDLDPTVSATHNLPAAASGRRETNATSGRLARELAERVRIPLPPTPAANPRHRSEENRPLTRWRRGWGSRRIRRETNATSGRLARELAERVRIPLPPTPAANPRHRSEENRPLTRWRRGWDSNPRTA